MEFDVGPRAEHHLNFLRDISFDDSKCVMDLDEVTEIGKSSIIEALAIDVVELQEFVELRRVERYCFLFTFPIQRQKS